MTLVQKNVPVLKRTDPALSTSLMKTLLVYRPVVIVKPHPKNPNSPIPFFLLKDGHKHHKHQPAPSPSPWMMTTLKYNHSNTETARNCPTYSTSSKWGFLSLYRESTSKTHERHYLYTEDTVTVKEVGPGWIELRWVVERTMKRA